MNGLHTKVCGSELKYPIDIMLQIMVTIPKPTIAYVMHK